MQMVKKILAWLLITACLLGAGITQAFAVTVGGTAYTHPVEVQNSTVWYNQNGDSRQIGGDAHTYNLIRRYEGDQSANNFYVGRGGKLKVTGAVLNQNLWRKNKDTGAWQSHATDYSWLVRNGAGSVMNNALTGKVYLSNSEYNSKNKAFAIIGKVGASPSGRQYNINTNTFDLERPLLQLTPVYQETKGKAGFWLARNTMSVQYQGIGITDMQNIPVTIKGRSVPSSQYNGSFAEASKGNVQRTMRYGGRLDGSANVNPSSAQEQVYNYLTCNTDTQNRVLNFSNLSYGNWLAQITNNTGKDYTLQISYKTVKGSIYKQYTSGAGDGYDIISDSRTLDFPRGSTLTLPAAMLYAGGYINYTLKLIPKAPNQVTVNMLGLDASERGMMIAYLDRRLDNGSYDTPWFAETSKTWTNQGAGSYGIGITSLSTFAYDVKVTLDYRLSKNDGIRTVTKAYHLDSISLDSDVPGMLKTPTAKLSDGGMANYTIEFYKDVSSRRVEVNLQGMQPEDLSDMLLDPSTWHVKKAAAQNGPYSRITALPWMSGTSIGIDIPNGGDSSYYQTDFPIVNREKYKLQMVRCTVIDTASGRVVRSYDDATYPSSTAVAAITRLPYNLNGDNKKLTLNGVAQNGVQIKPGQTAVYDIVLKQQGLFQSNIKTFFHQDAAIKLDNSDSLRVALCRPDQADQYDLDGVIATGLLKNGAYDFGTRQTGKKYLVKFLNYDAVGYTVTPAAGNSPTVNSLGITGWSAHFYGKCAPISVLLSGSAPAADKAGIPIEVATYDETAQTFAHLADITTNSSGKAVFQPEEFGRQYYFIPKSTPEHCYFPMSKVSAEQYTGAGQTVSLPLERLEPVTAVMTAADGMTEPVAGKKIDVYTGVVTNAEAVENGDQPVYDYTKTTTITTGSSGRVDYSPDRPGMALRFVPRTLEDTEIIITPAMAETYYTGTAQTVQFQLADKNRQTRTVIRFEDTRGRGISGISGTLASTSGSTRYAVNTDNNGDCIVYGLLPGSYVFRPEVVPSGTKPVHAKNYVLSTSAGTSLPLADKDITDYSDMTVQIAAGAVLNVIKDPLQYVVYTLDREELEDDVDISFHQPNEAYKKGTQVVSTFILQNNTDTPYTPDAPLKVNAKFIYTQGGVEKSAYIGDKANVILPPNGSQIVYFKWTVPIGADAGAGRIRASVSLGDGSVVHGTTLVTEEVQVIDKTVSATPDTKFDTQSGKYYTYATPQKDKDYQNYTTWQEWVWENENYVKRSYAFKLRTQELTIYPDETNPSSTYTPLTGYTMRSGYAIKLRYLPKYVDNAPDDGLTIVQDVQAFFPEFQYAEGSSKQRTLELNGGQWKFRVNPYSTFKPGKKGDGRKHFTPMWFPDKPYQVQILATDCWTPVGMLSYLDNTNKIKIKGNLYDDYYVSSGGSSVGGVEIKPGS